VEKTWSNPELFLTSSQSFILHLLKSQRCVGPPITMFLFRNSDNPVG
jgi:hypothetical protein